MLGVLKSEYVKQKKKKKDSHAKIDKTFCRANVNALVRYIKFSVEFNDLVVLINKIKLKYHLNYLYLVGVKLKYHFEKLT